MVEALHRIKNGWPSPWRDLLVVAPIPRGLHWNAYGVCQRGRGTERIENLLNLAHDMMNIRYSDILQALSYPDSLKAVTTHLRHKPEMEFSFDRNLVRAEMKRQRVNQAALAKAIGLTSQSAMSSILAGTRSVKVDEARRIYSHLNLIAGITEPIRSVPIIGLTNAGNWREAVHVPIGSMSIPQAIGSKQAFAIEVSGDSMDLLIEAGGYILVDPDQRQLFDGKVYLIENAEYETTVKRYRANPARFTPMSTNPEHQEFELGDGRYKVIGRVVWKGGTVD